MDANRYATKKTIAQGMLDIALLTANASQLKYILQIGQRHEFYKLMLTLISMSIILQVGVTFLWRHTKFIDEPLQVVSGILSLSLSLMRDCRLHLKEYQTSANIINNIRTGMAIITTMLNLFISAFDSRLPPSPLISSDITK